MTYQERAYRKLMRGPGIVFFTVEYFETDLMIGAQRNLQKEALQMVKKCRKELEAYISDNPVFFTSLRPLKVSSCAPEIVKKMAEASQKVSTGPMSAVAGAFSEITGKELLKYSGEVIVENGGDIFIKTGIPRKIGIYAGNSPLSEKVALEIDPASTPLGICTSSGTVGHSLSFGRADAVVVVSRDALLADAAATAVCNMVKTADDMEKAAGYASAITGLDGVVIIMEDMLCARGNIRLAGL